MGLILKQDKIGALSYSSSTIYMAPSILTIGGRQYKTISNLSVALSGLTANTLYMIYAVVSGGVVSLVTSTNVNSTGPSGYIIWKLVGAFYASAATTLGSFVNIEGSPQCGGISYTPTVAGLGSGSYSSNTGKWFRDGSKVTITAGFLKDATGGTGTDYVQVSIPFTALAAAGTIFLQYGVGVYQSAAVGLLSEAVYLSSNAMALYRRATQYWYRGQDVEANSRMNFLFIAEISGWSNAPLKDL